MKKIYIVRTSDDGILGAYSNKKNAWSRIENTFIKNGHKVDMTYSKLCKEFRKYNDTHFDIELLSSGNSYGTTMVEIKECILND